MSRKTNLTSGDAQTPVRGAAAPRATNAAEATDATDAPRPHGDLTRARVLEDADALIAYLRGRLPPLEEPVVPSVRLRAAGVLVPIYARDARPHVLFTLRALTLGYHSGEMSFPGGGREPGDANLAATALRETEEELAIPSPRVEILGSLAPMNAVVSNNWIAPVVGWLDRGLPSLTPNPSEVAEVIEAPLAALADPSIFHIEQWTRGGVARSIYFYDLGPYRIWGITGWILTQFLALLPPA